MMEERGREGGDGRDGTEAKEKEGGDDEGSIIMYKGKGVTEVRERKRKRGTQGIEHICPGSLVHKTRVCW